MAIRNLFVVFVASSLFAFTSWGQPPSESNVDSVVDAFQAMLEQKDNWKNSIEKVFASQNRESLVRRVAEIRKRTAGHEAADIMIGSDHGTFVFETPSGPVEVKFRLTANPVRIESIDVGENEPPLSPITWDSLESDLTAAAKDGLTGAALVTRRGKVVLHQAFGLANRAKKIPNKPDTVFAIGSAPIDFTHASLLILKDQGKLKFTDPITKYFDNVSDDKKAITIRHLMTGRSGLPDFHDLPTDKEPDHSWIDRDEAVRRIMNQKLLFKPGEGDRHSHSAWGLLAAIVEIASGQSYQKFTRVNLYKPAGMKDTGFFGDEVPESRIAVGYGFRKSTEPNAPPHWGKTSWLVMGSGGQISTLSDLYRWEVAIRAGKIMSPESTKSFVGMGNRVSADGDMYGFEFMHSHDPECMFMIA
ncbi:MAG: serine hydrolase domain-containing protein [Planctomycetota bacterium]